MINFFRKIRKKMADDNKPLKYARYAIGEIVLVVIGILIALSINNWNEDRIDRNLERKYLESIRRELDINIRTALFLKMFNDFQIQNGEIILDCLDNNFIQDQTEFAVAIAHLGYQIPVNYLKNVWNELYATGNIGIIQSDSIKNNLVELYLDMNDVLSHEEQEWSKYNFGYRRLVGDVLPPRLSIEFVQNLSPIKYTGEPIKFENSQEIIEKLAKLSGLNGYLVDIITTRKVSSEVYLSKQIELMQKINAMIDEEL